MADEKLNMTPADAPAPENPAPGKAPAQDAPAKAPGDVVISADQIEKLMAQRKGAGGGRQGRDAHPGKALRQGPGGKGPHRTEADKERQPKQDGGLEDYIIDQLAKETGMEIEST